MTYQELKSYLHSVGKTSVNITSIDFMRDGGSIQFLTDTGADFYVDAVREVLCPFPTADEYTDMGVITDLYLAIKRLKYSDINPEFKSVNEFNRLKDLALNRLHKTYPYLAQINSMGV